jgi:predicted RNase H-like HicB family nuclease
MRHYAIVIEEGPTNDSGYVPDLPVCFTVGASREEVEANLQEAIAAHVETLRELGMPIPEPASLAPNASYIEIMDEADTQSGITGD